MKARFEVASARGHDHRRAGQGLLHPAEANAVDHRPGRRVLGAVFVVNNAQPVNPGEEHPAISGPQARAVDPAVALALDVEARREGLHAAAHEALDVIGRHPADPAVPVEPEAARRVGDDGGDDVLDEAVAGGDPPDPRPLHEAQAAAVGAHPGEVRPEHPQRAQRTRRQVLGAGPAGAHPLVNAHQLAFSGRPQRAVGPEGDRHASAGPGELRPAEGPQAPTAGTIVHQHHQLLAGPADQQLAARAARRRAQLRCAAGRRPDALTAQGGAVVPHPPHLVGAEGEQIALVIDDELPQAEWVGARLVGNIERHVKSALRSPPEQRPAGAAGPHRPVPGLSDREHRRGAARTRPGPALHPPRLQLKQPAVHRAHPEAALKVLKKGPRVDGQALDRRGALHAQLGVVAHQPIAVGPPHDPTVPLGKPQVPRGVCPAFNARVAPAPYDARPAAPDRAGGVLPQAPGGAEGLSLGQQGRKALPIEQEELVGGADQQPAPGLRHAHEIAQPLFWRRQEYRQRAAFVDPNQPELHRGPDRPVLPGREVPDDAIVQGRGQRHGLEVTVWQALHEPCPLGAKPQAAGGIGQGADEPIARKDVLYRHVVALKLHAVVGAEPAKGRGPQPAAGVMHHVGDRGLRQALPQPIIVDDEGLIGAIGALGARAEAQSERSAGGEAAEVGGRSFQIKPRSRR